MYQCRRPGRSDFVAIRHHRYHVRLWGEAAAQRPVWVMLHGWMDVAASWQFAIDAMAQDHFIVAPDWRGFGRTEGAAVDNYWFPDYLTDLDLLLDHYAGAAPVNLVGHSMGGNVAMLYAGIRPQRVRGLVNLEGFGLPPTRPSQAPGRYAKWMDEIKLLHQGGMALQSYDSVEGVAQRLMKTNRRLPQEKALWLAQQWSAQASDGRWHILGDAAHKITGAQLYRADEAAEVWRRIEAPVLWVDASDDSLAAWWKGRFTQAEHNERLAVVPKLERATVVDAGHMLHHDQPQQVAQHIETFFAKCG